MQRLPYTKLAPDAYNALAQVGRYVRTATSLDPVLVEFVDLRASQLNGCEFCIAMHMHQLQQANEPNSRIDAVARWQESDAFTPREKAALAWAEELTNVQENHASDEAYAAVSEFFHDKDLVDLTYAIVTINAWNRLAIAFQAEWHRALNPREAQPPARTASPTA
jgi:AhpD family alkylhydroperoxidase